jgi:putative DNA primase/helicase
VNALVDASSVADAALRQVDEGQGPLVLSAAVPLDSARQLIRRRYMQPGARTIHHQQNTFYLWCGTRYRDIDREEIRAQVYEFLDSARRLDGETLVPFNPNRNKVGDVLDALAAAAQLPSTKRAPTWLDDERHPSATDVLACSNGLVHLPTRTVLPHTPVFFGVNAVDYRYEPQAKEPTAWFAFLKSIWPDDKESIATLQELFGLLLTPDTSHQKAFLIVGPKRSGKGTIARILTAMFGKENVAAPTLSSLTQNFGLAPLIGKPLAIISDARLSGRADGSVVVERLLAVTGEDAITVDRKFREAWTGRLPTRFLILTNELPRLADASGALASRFIVLTLRKSFYGSEDFGLTERLLKELPGILNWAMAGRDRLAARRRFMQPQSSAQAIEELEDLASPIGAFIRARCILAPERCVECSRLFTDWKAWCERQGREHVGTVQGFGRDLRAAVPGLNVAQPRAEDGTRLRYYQGLDLDPDKAWQD